jgi:geranylgeranyl diphosphate synthase type I
MTIVHDTLDHTRELLGPAMRSAVERLDDHTRLVASYHLGWCDEDGVPVTGPAGKSVRPTIVMLVADVLGGTAEDAIPGAVAIELVHNFSLLHDDLIDRDDRRRHRRTVWAIWGDATAVLAGDALLSLAHEVIGEVGHPAAERAQCVLAVATRALIRGQVLDVAFERRPEVSLAECFDMAAGKTGSLMGASAELGAVLAGAPPDAVDAFGHYGTELGVAFQLLDDLLGIWGDPARTGKPVFSDLRSRKKTLPVAWSLEHGGAAARELRSWLDDPTASSEADLAAAAALIERAGGRAWALSEARDRVRRARASLDLVAELAAAGQPRERLDELADFIVERQL